MRQESDQALILKWLAFIGFFLYPLNKKHSPDLNACLG